MKVKRAIRLSECILKEVSSMFLKDIKDPRIGFITFTRVELSDDLKYAKIFYSVIGSEKEKKRTLVGLNSACGFIRKELGKRLELKSLPELFFKIDNSLEEASRVYKLIDTLNENA